MVKLSEEMKKMIGEQLPFLSTASGFGLPQIGPKGSLHVFENDNLVYYEHTFKQAYENIKQNGHVAVAVIDKIEEKGFRFEGNAEIHEGDDFARNILATTKIFERFPRAAVVLIKINHIYKLDNTLEAGDKIV